MFDGRWRTGLDAATRPVGSALQRRGVSADHLTAAGLGFAVVTAIAIGTGHLFIGLVLLVASALPDMLDGAVAKASGTASPRGAYFDSVADRVTDSLVLGGMAWYLASAHGSHAAVLALAVLGLSFLISYQRAKAESLGYAAKGGLMERAERIVVLCFGLAFPVLLVPVLWLLVVLTAVTNVQRFVKVWRQASAALPGHVVRPPRLPRTSRVFQRAADAPRRWERRWEQRAPSASRWRRRAGTRP
jgi:CDP-diacylglycerol--glycerol-3-phosphate 3-phosphatidyltransferase